MDEEQRQALRVYFPPAPSPEFLIPRVNQDLEFTLLDFEEEREIYPPNCAPCTRYLFNVIDHADGKVKVLSVGKKIARDLSQLILEPKKPPQRHWFMRLLEWLRIIQPLPDEFYEEFEIHGDFKSRPFPTYHVRALS